MYRLNISGLTSKEAELAHSRCYVMLSKNEEAGIELAISSASNQYTNFIVSQNIERFFDCNLFTNATLTYEGFCNYVKPFEIDENFFLDNPNVYFKRLFEELSFYSKFKRSLTILHLSENMLVSMPALLLEKIIPRIRQIASQNKSCIVLLLSGRKALDYRSSLMALSDQLGGLINIETEATRSQLIYDFWHHTQGVSKHVIYNVELAGSYRAIQQTKEDEPLSANGFVDNDKVYINKKLLRSNTKLPPNYDICDDNDEIYYLAKIANAATLIFCADKDEDKEELAKKCFRLRKQRGNWLKIVIKNNDGVLRHHDECVFLTLGVNLIMHTTTDISRIMSQVQAIQGIKFGRLLPADYVSVLDNAKSSDLKGYLPAHEFVDEVKKQRDAALNTGTSGVLVCLRLLPRIQPLDVLSLFSLNRSGDIITASEKVIYLYLHACRENDVDVALTRLFRLSIREFFSEHQIHSQDLYVDEVLRELRKQAMAREVRDYSDSLSQSKNQLIEQASNSSQFFELNTGPPERQQPQKISLKLKV